MHITLYPLYGHLEVFAPILLQRSSTAVSTEMRNGCQLHNHSLHWFMKFAVNIRVVTMSNESAMPETDWLGRSQGNKWSDRPFTTSPFPNLSISDAVPFRPNSRSRVCVMDCLCLSPWSPPAVAEHSRQGFTQPLPQLHSNRPGSIIHQRLLQHCSVLFSSRLLASRHASV